jgi:hypothetical protein
MAPHGDDPKVRPGTAITRRRLLFHEAPACGLACLGL